MSLRDQITISTLRERVPLSELVQGPVGSRSLSLHHIRLSENGESKVNIVGISAEPVVEYVRHIEEALPDCFNLPVGYIDEVYGYLPTSKMAREGGYEVNAFRKSFSLEGKLRPDVEERLKMRVEAFLSRRWDHPTEHVC